jgi:hypothetical protein
MATPKKKYPYAIYYKDGSYMIYDLTTDDYATLVQGVIDNAHGVVTSVGLLVLEDIRSIIEQKPEPKVKKVKEEKPAYPDLDAESVEWLNEFMKQEGMN